MATCKNWGFPSSLCPTWVLIQLSAPCHHCQSQCSSHHGSWHCHCWLLPLPSSLLKTARPSKAPGKDRVRQAGESCYCWNREPEAAQAGEGDHSGKRVRQVGGGIHTRPRFSHPQPGHPDEVLPCGATVDPHHYPNRRLIHQTIFPRVFGRGKSGKFAEKNFMFSIWSWSRIYRSGYT